jgi:hypothetical protein
MTSRARYVIDMLERAVFTYLESFFGILLVANVFDSSQPGKLLTLLSAAQVAAVSALPTGLAVLKALFAKLAGDPDSASLAPQVPNPVEP